MLRCTEKQIGRVCSKHRSEYTWRRRRVDFSPQVLTKSIFNTVAYNSKRLVQRRNIGERRGDTYIYVQEVHRKWEKSTCSRRNWVIEGFRQEFLTPFPCPPDNLRSTLHLYYRGSRRGDKSVDRKYRENSSELNRFVGRKKEKKGVGMDISFPELRQCRLNTLFYRKLCDIHTFLIDTNFSNLPFLFFTRHDISWTEFPFLFQF